MLNDNIGLRESGRKEERSGLEVLTLAAEGTDSPVLFVVAMTAGAAVMFWASLRSVGAKKRSREALAGSNARRFLGKVSSARGLHQIMNDEVPTGRGEIRVGESGVYVDLPNGWGSGNGGR